MKTEREKLILLKIHLNSQKIDLNSKPKNNDFFNNKENAVPASPAPSKPTNSNLPSQKPSNASSPSPSSLSRQQLAANLQQQAIQAQQQQQQAAAMATAAAAAQMEPLRRGYYISVPDDDDVEGSKASVSAA